MSPASSSRQPAAEDPRGGHAQTGNAGLPIPDYTADALRGAIALLRADGGEVALFDATRQHLVTRARITHAQSSALGGIGRAPASGGLAPARLPHAKSAPSAPEIDQDTVVMQSPARIIALGEGPLGLAAKMGSPVLFEARQYPDLARASADPEASWHLAVPIFDAGSLAEAHGSTVMGAISVHVRNPQWGFTQQHIELLTLHADRLARSMQLAKLDRQTLTVALPLEIMRGLSEGASDPASLYGRLRATARKLFDAPSFAVARFTPGEPGLRFDAAERDGVPVGAAGAEPAPAWWPVVSRGQLVRVSTTEERATYPQICIPGWGGPVPVQSLMAAPLWGAQGVVGAVAIASPRSDAYGVEHEAVFEILSRAASLVIEQDRFRHSHDLSEQHSRAQSEQMAILVNALLALRASLALDETLSSFATTTAQMTTAEHTIVMLLDEDNRELRGKAIGTKIGAQAPRRKPDEITVSPDWRGMRQAMETEQFLLLDNLKSDWDNAGTLGHLFKEHKVPACLIVPIVQHEVPGGSPGNGRPLGILIAYSDGRIPFEQHAISQPVSQLQGIAGQAATNISNALMHEALTRSYEERVMLDKLKDEFILTISHEFRTPLTAVSGFIAIVRRIVRQHSDQMDEQKLTEFTEEIQRASNQIVSLVTMLSDASRMPSQPLQLGRKHTMLWKQADVAVHGFTPEMRQRISSNISPDIAVFADEDRLQIVFTNLVSNALRYTKGPVEISAREISRASLAQAKRSGAAEPSAPERWIVTSVRDHGQGIPEADRERIFDKFVRLERSLTSDVRGTGLGLWICHEYLRAMGGDIWVTNAPGGGADFQLALPVSLTAPEP